MPSPNNRAGCRLAGHQGGAILVTWAPAVVVLALLMVPVFFVSVQRVLAGDREPAKEPVVEPLGSPEAL